MKNAEDRETEKEAGRQRIRQIARLAAAPRSDIEALVVAVADAAEATGRVRSVALTVLDLVEFVASLPEEILRLRELEKAIRAFRAASCVDGILTAALKMDQILEPPAEPPPAAPRLDAHTSYYLLMTQDTQSSAYERILFRRGDSPGLSDSTTLLVNARKVREVELQHGYPPGMSVIPCKEVDRVAVDGEVNRHHLPELLRAAFEPTMTPKADP